MRPVPSEPTLMSRLPPMIDVPTLVVDGTADRVLPFSATAERLSGLISDVKLVPIKDGPHAITWTRPDGVSTALLELLAD